MLQISAPKMDKIKPFTCSQLFIRDSTVEQEDCRAKVKKIQKCTKVPDPRDLKTSVGGKGERGKSSEVERVKVCKHKLPSFNTNVSPEHCPRLPASKKLCQVKWSDENSSCEIPKDGISHKVVTGANELCCSKEHTHIPCDKFEVLLDTGAKIMSDEKASESSPTKSVDDWTHCGLPLEAVLRTSDKAVSPLNHGDIVKRPTSETSAFVQELPFADCIDLSSVLLSKPKPALDDVFDISPLFSATFKKSYNRIRWQENRKRKHSVSKKTPKDHGDDEEEPKRKRPNYFVAIQINQPQITENLTNVLNAVKAESAKLKPLFINLAKLHLTMLVTTLNSPEEIELAKEAMETVCGSLPEPFECEIKGIDSFKKEVVFANVTDGHERKELQKIADMLKAAFRESDLKVDDKEFKPHLTLMKLSKLPPKLLKKIGLKKIDPAVYRAHAVETFGVQPVWEVQLCSMLETDKETGYYRVLHQVPLGKSTANDTEHLSVQGNQDADALTMVKSILNEVLRTVTGGGAQDVKETAGLSLDAMNSDDVETSYATQIVNSIFDEVLRSIFASETINTNGNLFAEDELCCSINRKVSNSPLHCGTTLNAQSSCLCAVSCIVEELLDGVFRAHNTVGEHTVKRVLHENGTAASGVADSMVSEEVNSVVLELLDTVCQSGQNG